MGGYDFLFRRYNPVAGRWLSPDPAGWAAVQPENPQTLDRYAYVINNPMAYVDSGGLDYSVCLSLGCYGYNDSTYALIFNGQSASVADFAPGFSGGAVNTSSGTESTSTPENGVAMTYYLGDPLGSTQMEFASGGWPTWQGQFAPFGQELDTQPTTNNYKFTGLEHDGESSLDHATFRQYASGTGRWMSADPYDGSMDLNNPQTLNRYAYVGNMPVSFTDPTGLDGLPTGFLGQGFGCIGAIATGGTNVGADLGCAFSLGSAILNDFLHPKFKGSHSPRPNAHPWDEHGSYQVKPYSAADILGLSNGGCEFGACGGLGGDFQNAGTMAGPAIGGAVVCAAAEPCGAIALGVGAAVVIGGAIYEGTQIYRGRTNVSDTGITSEAQQLVSSGKFPSICAALSYLQSTTRDSARLQKIKATQKAFGCRRNSTQS